MAKANVVATELGRVQLVGERALVRPSEKPRKTEGGILLPDQYKPSDKTTRSVVVRVGPGKLMDDGSIRPLQVKEGDTVLHTSYHGTLHRLDGEEYLLLHETEILAVLPEAK